MENIYRLRKPTVLSKKNERTVPQDRPLILHSTTSYSPFTRQGYGNGSIHFFRFQMTAVSILKYRNLQNATIFAIPKKAWIAWISGTPSWKTAWISRGQCMDSKAAHTLSTAYPHGLPQFRTMPLTHPIHTTTVTTKITSFFMNIQLTEQREADRLARA